MTKYLIIKILFFISFTYVHIALAESEDVKCSKILGSIIVETELSEKDKLNKWSDYKDTCSKDDFYYIGQAQIYSLRNAGHGVNYIHKLLDEKKITYTKDIMFFLGTGCDAYAFQQNEEALEVLKGFADILINDYKNSATGYFLKGCYFFHQNNLNQAEYYYKKAKELGKTNNDKLFQTVAIRDLTIRRAAIIAYRQNKYKLCIGFYKKAFELNEFGTLVDSFVSNAVTKSLFKLGNCKDARKLMDLRKELFPQFAKGKNFIDLEQEYNQTCSK